MDRRAKIVCTLGPATYSEEQLTALIDAGMNVARMNFSHGDHADHEVVYHRVRAVAEKLGKPVGILGDLQGPKIRLGRFADGPSNGPTATRSPSPSTTSSAPTTGCRRPTPVWPTTRGPATGC